MIDLDKVMTVLEVASQHSPREDGWVSVGEIRGFADNASISPVSITPSRLARLVKDGRVETRVGHTRPYSPHVEKLYRPSTESLMPTSKVGIKDSSNIVGTALIEGMPADMLNEYR